MKAYHKNYVCFIIPRLAKIIRMGLDIFSLNATLDEANERLQKKCYRYR